MLDEDGRFNVTAAGDSKDVELIGRALVEGPAKAVFVEGNFAYLCARCTFVILDVSNPAQPVKLGRVVLPDIAQDVYVSGNYAYVADYKSFTLNYCFAPSKQTTSTQQSAIFAHVV